LEKQGGKTGFVKFQKRFFAISQDKIEYGESPDKVINSIHRNTVIDCRTPLKGEFKKSTKQKENGFVLNTSSNGRAYILAAESVKERDEWISFIVKWIDETDVVLKSRKMDEEKISKREEITSVRKDNKVETKKEVKESNKEVKVEKDKDSDSDSVISNVSNKSDKSNKNDKLSTSNNRESKKFSDDERSDNSSSKKEANTSNNNEKEDDSDEETFTSEKDNEEFLGNENYLEEEEFLIQEELPLELKSCSIGPRIDLESRLLYSEKEIQDVIQEIEQKENEKNDKNWSVCVFLSVN